MLDDRQLARKSLQYRRDTLRYIKNAGAGHTGGSLSCVDILNVLYNRILRVTPGTFAAPTRDRYVQSKGHSVEALFVVLADKGFYDAAELENLCRYESHFVGHPTRKVPGIEQNTGALGHGLSICTGMALGGKMDTADFRVFTLLGDGELAEGSNWEAAMAAAHYELPALTDALAEPLESGKPGAIIARTTKGKGVSFMEDVGKWHHGVPSDDEYKLAISELDAALAAIPDAAA